jgi:hypothetical protein
MINSKFRDGLDAAEEDNPFHSDIFLVADKAVIDSYLSSHLGEQGYILAIDVDYDTTSEENRADESPGYEGWICLLGSLLWDDLSPLLLCQTQHLQELWPLAKDDGQKVYRTPIVTVCN